MGYDSTGNWGRQNNLWKFDGTNWTWVTGSDVRNQAGVYGIEGTADPANIPGGRNNGTSWIDSSDNLWLFGGYGYDSAGNGGMLNDLWKFEHVCDRKILGDVNNDCRYDLIDFAMSASYWLDQTSWQL